MDTSAILGHTLQETWRICRRRPALLAPGLLAVVGSGGGSAVQLLLAQLALPLPGRLDLWAEALPRLDVSQITMGSLAWGTLFVLGLLLVGWLLFAWAEAALIHAVLADAAGEPGALRRDLWQGARWLGRFVAIDALVFLPLFLLLLALLLLVGGAVVVAGVSAVRGGGPAALLAALGVAGLCALPLLCVALPLSVATAVFRGLAFRETAVSGIGARGSIRAAWRLLRAQWPAFLLLTALLLGAPYALRLASTALTA
ncbi:MAG: hypothetical protein KC425_02850, partial [Anaerolineales bacterium]|nr:hypothetical protein [Anaerolineales bacterium]